MVSSPAGCRTRAAGQGAWDRELLQRFIQRVDADEASAYLETDRPENLAFYGQVGFDVVREVEVLGITVWCMQRPARAKTSKFEKLRENPGGE